MASTRTVTFVKLATRHARHARAPRRPTACHVKRVEHSTAARALAPSSAQPVSTRLAPRSRQLAKLVTRHARRATGAPPHVSHATPRARTPPSSAVLALLSAQTHITSTAPPRAKRATARAPPAQRAPNLTAPLAQLALLTGKARPVLRHAATATTPTPTPSAKRVTRAAPPATAAPRPTASAARQLRRTCTMGSASPRVPLPTTPPLPAHVAPAMPAAPRAMQRAPRAAPLALSRRRTLQPLPEAPVSASLATLQRAQLVRRSTSAPPARITALTSTTVATPQARGAANALLVTLAMA
mmetsp:Transcript_1897/g.3838  ORF Transcript_1897/g.3838 Transcript_1897/m.3838 type:complete len:299 (+) Transcript_1897:886-1782(+)